MSGIPTTRIRILPTPCARPQAECGPINLSRLRARRRSILPTHFPPTRSRVPSPPCENAVLRHRYRPHVPQATGSNAASSRLIKRSLQPQSLRSRGVCPSCRTRIFSDSIIWATQTSKLDKAREPWGLHQILAYLRPGRSQPAIEWLVRSGKLRISTRKCGHAPYILWSLQYCLTEADHVDVNDAARLVGVWHHSWNRFIVPTFCPRTID